MELQTRTLFVERAIGLYLALQLLAPTHFNLTSSITGFLILTIIKYHLEGFRVNYFIFILAQIIALTPYSLLHYVPALILTVVALIYFPVYKYPLPSGPYKVGYKRFSPTNDIIGAIYYPTNETTVDVTFTHDIDGWKRFAEIIVYYAKVKGRKYAPKLFYKFILSFLEHQYMGVNLNAKIAQPDRSQKFPIILFSHGLAANIHTYSTQIKEWASHGFIVISVDHDELIPLRIMDLRQYQEYVQLRAEQLVDRKNTMRQLLNYICIKKNIQEMFPESSVRIDYGKVILAGHSFGGATACELAAEDKRVTGGLVLLDPWLEPCSKQVFSAPLDKPILLVRSETFDQTENFKASSVKYIQANQQDKGLMISGFFKGTTHHYSSDLQLHMPREMLLFKSIKAMHNLADLMMSQTALTQLFLKRIVESDPKTSKVKSIKNDVLDKFRDHLRKMSKEDILETDGLF